MVDDESNTATDSLPVLYQDDALIVVNKPSGLLVHRSPIDRHETRFALQMVRNQVGRWVYPVHRLDKPTSGALIFAFDPDSARALGEQMMARQVEKQYLAVVRGYAPDSGTIDYALTEEPDARMPGRSERSEPQPAVSHFRCLARAELDVCIERYPQSRFSLVTVSPETGRRHQIRRHLKHISHPIIGDAKHGRGRYNRYFKTDLNSSRLLLAATEVSFQHPVTGYRIKVQAPLDEDMQQLLRWLGWSSWAEHFAGPEWSF